MSRLIDADDLIIEILTHDLTGDDKKVDKMIVLFNEEKFMNNTDLWTLG